MSLLQYIGYYTINNAIVCPSRYYTLIVSPVVFPISENGKIGEKAVYVFHDSPTAKCRDNLVASSRFISCACR